MKEGVFLEEYMLREIILCKPLSEVKIVRTLSPLIDRFMSYLKNCSSWSQIVNIYRKPQEKSVLDLSRSVLKSRKKRAKKLKGSRRYHDISSAPTAKRKTWVEKLKMEISNVHLLWWQIKFAVNLTHSLYSQRKKGNHE